MKNTLVEKCGVTDYLRSETHYRFLKAYSQKKYSLSMNDRENCTKILVCNPMTTGNTPKICKILRRGRYEILHQFAKILFSLWDKSTYLDLKFCRNNFLKVWNPVRVFQSVVFRKIVRSQRIFSNIATKFDRRIPGSCLTLSNTTKLFTGMTALNFASIHKNYIFIMGCMLAHITQLHRKKFCKSFIKYTSRSKRLL